MRTPDRNISKRHGDFLLVLGSYLLFASAACALPAGQRDRYDPVSMMRIAASVILRLRPREQSLASLPAADIRLATRSLNPHGKAPSNGKLS